MPKKSFINTRRYLFLLDQETVENAEKLNKYCINEDNITFRVVQDGIQKLQDFIKKTKNWFSFANILLVALEIVPFALNTTICTIKKIVE